MLDPASLGRSFGPYTVAVEAGRLRALAEALGDAGLAAPPTFPTCYGLWANTPLLAELAALGAPLPRLLHGEQRYAFHAPVAPGDTLTAAPQIVGLEQKAGRSGPFQLVTLETRWHTPAGRLAIADTLVVVVRAAGAGPGAPGARQGPGRPAPNGSPPPTQPPAPHAPRPTPYALASGDELPPVELGPLARAQLAAYAAASGDHNPLHTDAAFARAAGLDDVIAHGMLVMGVMGRVAAAVAGPAAVAELQARFVATTAPGELLRCGGRVAEAGGRDGRPLATLELWARGDDGRLKASGSAAVALGGGGPA